MLPPEIRREKDAALVNAITNDPAVLPFISRHGGEIDWTPAIESEDCMVLSNGEDACMVLERTALRDWQMHTIFAPSCRGKRALDVARAMKDYMVPEHADLIFGSTPDSLGHARWFNSALGGERVEEIESGGETYRAPEGEILFVLRGVN